MHTLVAQMRRAPRLAPLASLLAALFTTTIGAAGTTNMAAYSTQSSPPFAVGIAMIGGSIPEGGDDIGPGTEVQLMIQRDCPVVTITGTACTSWAQAQPTDPGSGPNVYNWSSLDAGASQLIPGKALLAYYQMWGTSPPWVEEDTTRFWQKFQEFITAMTVYVNQHYGTVYYIFENEPNISRAPDGWNWADWYIHCLQHFHAAVHAANAQTGIENKTIAGNLAGHSAGGFQELYARGLKNCSDLLGYHPYPDDIRNGLKIEDLAQIRATQVTYGDDAKRIYVSEGWGSGRSAGFDRSSPTIEPTAQEVENMWLAMTRGYDNVMTPRENWQPQYLWGMNFFCGNDNWGAGGWRRRATPVKDQNGNITGFIVDGYHMTPDIAPYFWNGGMLDFYGNSKDCLIHVFPGDGLVFMNPGFELVSEPPNAHLPHFWTPLTTPASTADYAIDDTGLRGGSRSLKLSRTSGDNPGVSQMSARRSVTAGQTYRVRAWCRTQSASSLAARLCMCFCDLPGTTKSSKVWADDLTGTADWRLMEVSATAPPFAARIEMGCSISGIGAAWFDDVTVLAVGQQETGTIRGYTLDEQQIVVPNCIVRTTTGGLQAISDSTGYYEIANAPPGTYDLVCRQVGYVPHRVKNQTVAPGKLTFVSFNMPAPKPGLTVADVVCDQATLPIGGSPVTVTVTVANTKPYPNVISDVGVFIENAVDATGLFSIKSSPANPKVVPANGQSQFQFALSAPIGVPAGPYQVNAYAFGQEDRPDMLANGGFDATPWNDRYSFSGGADTLLWEPDSADCFSPPRSLRCYVADDEYTYNWANNWSAYGPSAIPAYPARNYTVGVHHKDNLTGGVSVDLYIQEYYYDGSRWYYNGRRFIGIPHHTAWTHDMMTYDTGDPAVTPGLYATNRLVVSCGPCTTPTAGSGYCWWDNLYLKETGDWLADDRATTGASLTVVPVPVIELSATRIDVQGSAGWNPPDQTFTIRNGGIGTINYAIASDVGWLSLNPAVGDSSGEPDTITVAFDTAGLVAGNHTGQITVTAPEAANSPRIIAVALTLTAVRPDFDGDGDVDQRDFGHLQECLSGPGISQNDPSCRNAWLDVDEDVDIEDFAVFHRCLTGPNLPAEPDCVNQ